MRTHHLLGLILIAPLFGCPAEEPPEEEECPGALKEAAQTCTAADCSATTGLKTFGESELDSATAKEWIVPVFATSEVAAANEMTTVRYVVETAGALTARRTQGLSRAVDRARAFLGDAVFESVYSPERAARIRAEAQLRESQRPFASDPSTWAGTAIRPRFELPKNVRRQSAACSASAPACGDAALCVIPEGTTEGTCESALTIKFFDGNNVQDVAATVKKVGTRGAIVTDDAVNVAQDQIDELLTRFDTHIAPLDHQFFGEPKDQQGKDRDGNGVVIIFLTPKVAERGVANLVGYFQSDDLATTAENPNSNAADILYMREPGASITLDQISGTLGHEYQHLINYYAKKIVRGSEQEEVWLDEGLASFAEDMLGYGSDAFENIAAFLGAVDQTSLTGNGNCPDGNAADSACRRGMAHLLVRYYFEQKGGADFGGAGVATDKGGIAAVKALVQTDNTGTLVFARETTGRTFHQWGTDLMTTIAVDGAGFKEVSCNPMYKLDPPADSEYTMYQVGIDVRTPFKKANGQTVTLNGPITADMMSEEVPLVANGGEIRTVSVASGKMKIGIGGASDYEVGYHAMPAEK
jgi:hypothetical protein